MNAQTTFKPIDGFPNYSVSSDGEVLSNGRWGKPVILAKFSMKGRAAYSYVNIYRERRMFTKRVAVLVCEAFHGQRPTPDHEAAHCNGVHNDDRASNLRWATRIENAQDRKIHGTQVCGTAVKKAKLDDVAVKEIRLAQKRYGYLRDLARKFGVGPSAISNVVREKTWRHVS